MKLYDIKTIAFDADDTLWANEHIFQQAREKSWSLVQDYTSKELWNKETFKREIGNLHLYGYGSKSYILSLIEAAIHISKGNISQEKIHKMLEIGKEMINEPVKLLPGVLDTLEYLHPHYNLMIITKGDLKEQEAKVEKSGLADLFSKIEIVSEKDTEVYRSILNKYSIEPTNFAMVGNSLKSDVLPVCQIGGIGIHIPYHITWEWEMISQKEIQNSNHITLERMDEIIGLFNLQEKVS